MVESLKSKEPGEPETAVRKIKEILKDVLIEIDGAEYLIAYKTRGVVL